MSALVNTSGAFAPAESGPLVFSRRVPIIFADGYYIPKAASTMVKIQRTVTSDLERAVAEAFYRVTGVEEVRLETRDEGVTLWILGNNLSDEAIEDIVSIELSLRQRFPTNHILVEVSDRFDRKQLRKYVFWEQLTLVKPAIHFSARA